MKVTFAQFHIEHRKEMYAVQYTLNGTYGNVSQVNINVIDGKRKTILARSESGRQIVSPWNAKNVLMEALTEIGKYKPHARKHVRTKKNIENI